MHRAAARTRASRQNHLRYLHTPKKDSWDFLFQLSFSIRYWQSLGRSSFGFLFCSREKKRKWGCRGGKAPAYAFRFISTPAA